MARRRKEDTEQGSQAPRAPTPKTTSRKRTPKAERVALAATDVSRALVGGGRKSVDLSGRSAFRRSFRQIITPPDPRTDWVFGNLDSRTFEKLAGPRILEYLTDLSPEASKGLWDWLRMCNPGWEWEVTTLDDKPNEAGQAVVDNWLAEIGRRHGAPEVVIARLFAGGWARGAFFSEIGFDQGGRRAIDLFSPDPATARFELQEDGSSHRLFQQQSGRRVYLDVEPAVRYVAIDPWPGSPYGRPLASPSMFVTLFMLGLMNDLKRVVMQQGYPRPDIKLIMETIKGVMDPDDRDDPKKVLEVFTQIREQVELDYANLEPDDAWVHSDASELDTHNGAVATGVLAQSAPLTELLERQSVRALKSIPLLMAIADGTSEANANRQWEIYVAGIKSIQHLLENSLADHGRLACQVAGIQAKVKVRFSELRVAEMMRDAQTERLKIENAFLKYAAGAITFGQMVAEMTDGGAIPDKLTEPRMIIAGLATDTSAEAQSTNPDPGSNRSPRPLVRLVPSLFSRAPFTPKGQPAGTSADPVDEDDAERIIDVWNDEMDRYAGLLEAEVQ